RLTPRQVLAVLGLAAVAFITAAALGMEQSIVTCAFVVWLAGSAAIVLTGGDGGASDEALTALSGAIDRVLDDKRPDPPPDAPPNLLRVYEALRRLHAHQAELVAKAGETSGRIDEALREANSALRQLGDG